MAKLEEEKIAMIGAKDFLAQIKTQKERTLYLEQDVAYLKGAMVSLGGPTFGVKSSGGIKDRAGFVAFVECKDQKERQLIAERERLAALIAQAERVIETVPDMKVRRVLKLFYLEDKSVTEIAGEMNYSKQHVNRLLNRGHEMAVLPKEKIPA